jgi:hypothetical protein
VFNSQRVQFFFRLFFAALGGGPTLPHLEELRRCFRLLRPYAISQPGSALKSYADAPIFLRTWAAGRPGSTL